MPPQINALLTGAIFLSLLFVVAEPFLPVQKHCLAQQLSAEDVARMSFDELLGQTIYSASKTEQSVFEAPLSATVLTRDEILRAGSTSIPEALRLVPGIIVREQTNGNYDVHVRGFDYLPVGSFLTNSAELLAETTVPRETRA